MVSLANIKRWLIASLKIDCMVFSKQQTESHCHFGFKLLRVLNLPLGLRLNVVLICIAWRMLSLHDLAGIALGDQQQEQEGQDNQPGLRPGARVGRLGRGGLGRGRASNAAPVPFSRLRVKKA